MITNFKAFEGTKYKDKEEFDYLFKFKIDDPVNFLVDALNGYRVPDLTEEIYFIQSRTHEKASAVTNGKDIIMYLLYDFDELTLNWVPEKDIKLATKEEVEEGRIRHEAKKYNI